MAGPDITGARTGSAATQFKPGAAWRGNAKGRPIGSRNKVCSALLDAITDDFLKYGPSVIVKVRKEQPAIYLKYVFGILPTHFGFDQEGGDGLRHLSELLAASQRLTQPD